jgi:hypothetical protein
MKFMLLAMSSIALSWENPGVQGFKVAADEYGNEIRFNPSLLMGR